MSNRTPKQRELDNKTRFRRAGAWIKEANNPLEPPARFVFSWIAFNAQYQDLSVREKWEREKKDSPEKKGSPEINMIYAFIEKISRSDGKPLARVIAKVEPDLRKIFELQQIHHGFWKKPDNPNISTAADWHAFFRTEKENCLEQLKDALAVRPNMPARAAAPMLESVFGRLYVVRNQVFHGGHSGAKNTSRGYTQIRHGAEVLFEMVKCFQRIMAKRMNESPNEDWGKVDFPRQGKKVDDPNCPPYWAAEKE